MSIHSRKAETEILDCLKKYKIKNAIFHWYSGGLKKVDEIIEAGYSFSINTAMIKSTSGRKIIDRIPIENVLIESDRPFIEYNGRRVKSSDLNVVYDYIAKSKGLSLDQSVIIIKNNFFKMLKQ